MGSCLGIISRRFASYALPFRVVTLALLPYCRSSLFFSSSSFSSLSLSLFSPFQTFSLCDDEVWYSKFANNARKYLSSRFLLEQKRIGDYSFRAWNARYVFGRLHRSSAPSYEHRIFINVSNRDLYFAYLFIRICRFDTRKDEIGIRETLAWYRANYWRLGVSLTSGPFYRRYSHVSLREWNNRSFIDRAVRTFGHSPVTFHPR